jgi:hypothetical protein
MALWGIPLAAALLPAIAGLVALLISVELGLIPACNPLWEGCVSISRAARHDLGNHIFRALVLPAAVFQGLTWVLCVPWIRSLGGVPDRMSRALPWIGVAAAVFLVLYGTFLGTEGRAYGWMRRFGIFFYFGFTCICMVIMAGQLRRLAAHAGFGGLLIGACLLLLTIGLADAFSPLYIVAEDTRDRMGNAIEWNAALIFTLYFFALAWRWRQTGFGASLRTL